MSAITNDVMDSSKLIFASCQQLPVRKYLFIQQEPDATIDLSALGHSIRKERIISVAPEKDIDQTIKNFLIHKLRKYYLTNLWIGFLVLFGIEGLKGGVLRYISKNGTISTEAMLHWRKIAEIGLPLVSLVIMIWLCIVGYRVVTTASVIKIKQEPTAIKEK
ncbi:MAG: hypothetical protein ACTHWQ_07375 [Sphingobacterium sp.]|uniref:hypothetical protein n=1 Tax=Sphingobacterium sp. JB170 TaxID=1434842 RepID=UPI001C4EB6C5|nr:hypothetical protein [Sphingobacterium sp. JB170]